MPGILRVDQIQSLTGTTAMDLTSSSVNVPLNVNFQSTVQANGVTKKFVDASTTGRRTILRANGSGEWVESDDMQRDNAVFGKPTIHWEGEWENWNRVFSGRILTRGSVGTDFGSYASGQWNYRFMFGVDGDNTSGSSNNHVYFRVPATPNVHNMFWLELITGDRWQTPDVWICNSAGVQQYRCGGRRNEGQGGSGNWFHLGPLEGPSKVCQYHEWLGFCIPRDKVEQYKDANNELYISVHRGANDAGRLWISGISVTPNPYGVCPLNPLDLHWASNGGAGFTWNSSNWNEGGLCQFNNNTDYGEIRLPIASITNGVYCVFQEHANSWYGSSPRVTLFDLNNDLNQFATRLSPNKIGRYGNCYRNRLYGGSPRGCYIPRQIVQQVARQDYGGQYQIRLRLYHRGESPMYCRGAYTETAEQNNPYERISDYYTNNFPHDAYTGETWR